MAGRTFKPEVLLARLPTGGAAYCFQRSDSFDWAGYTPVDARQKWISESEVAD